MSEYKQETITTYNDKINKLLKSIDARVLMSAYLATGATTMTNIEFKKFIDIAAMVIFTTALDDARDVLSLNKERNEMIKKLTL